ncbi:hypothetical protein [Geodermatophilus sp. CPCC 205506]|uniref:hypothetical protein n=1 Tax=Geodermatophilus sp. CPCC 205506 TaxID=2936596 RepID=UPI003EEF701F
MTPTTAAAPVSAIRRGGGLRGALTHRWPTALGAVAAVNSLVLVARLPEAAQAWISAWCVLLAAVIYLTWGTARGDLADRRLLTAQTAAVLGFGAVAIAAVAVDPAAARYVLAAGWLAHATWDVVHHRIGRVAPRWYAETCLVADLVLATALLTVGLP